MVVQLWDASALAKRYGPEVGSDTVDALFAAVPSSQKVSTAVSYAEIYSVLLRKFNRASIDRATFDAAKSHLRVELVNDVDFVLISVDDAAFYNGIALMERHNLNSTDAALLTLFLSYTQSFSPDGNATFLLIAADERLVRAAKAEGLNAVNPETLSATDVLTFLGSL